MRFAKGHGTGNDFVILPDPDGRLDLTPELVVALCDRHFGLGADGVLRVVRSAVAGGDAGGGGGSLPSGSWTTGTPTAALPRCAGTASASSRSICSMRASPRD